MSGREVTTATVAAILTVLGYSIYDTIIVFDRVRENIPLMRRASFATIANVSLWETMRRSLATTFITLLPIGSLLLFGGETLKDFAFALFIGIGLGAVSTFFVATPFLTVLMERAPEFRGRIGAEVMEKGVGGGAAARGGGGRARAGAGSRARRCAGDGCSSRRRCGAAAIEARATETAPPVEAPWSSPIDPRGTSPSGSGWPRWARSRSLPSASTSSQVSSQSVGDCGATRPVS